jgi:S-DNA-T family DNA segregation ATPase FtsK/SpoIIIE
MPEGQIELQEPPALVESSALELSSVMTVLPMGLMAGAMMFMYSGAGGGIRTYLGSGMMGLAMVGMMAGQMGRSSGDKNKKLKTERRDYMRYLTQVRKQVRLAMDQQRAAVFWDHPDPNVLWSLALGRRLWERRTSHQDFAEVRIGLGSQRAKLRLIPPQSKPIEDLEPMCAGALRRFIRAYAAVPEVPTALYLPGMSSVSMSGEDDRLRGLARSIIAQLVTFHAPEELRIAVLAGPEQVAQWDWTKWLPHLAHPVDVDGAGPVRLFATDHGELLGMLAPLLGGHSGFGTGVEAAEAYRLSGEGPSTNEPFLVVVSDGVSVPTDSRLLALTQGKGVLLDLGANPGQTGSVERPHAVHLAIESGQIAVTSGNVETKLGVSDSLGRSRCESLARLIAPLRTSGTIDATEALTTDFEMTRLVGIRDVRRFDVHALWRSRARSGALRVPIGLGEDGSIVELDIKESAQGGMGPHGMLIGATGSGKSELLRTLVITLATTHSSEQLNFVLIDFKGGATFLGLDALPHTSAVITNLADELQLVDRMQASLHGELIRRQEALRRYGYSSALDYEKARAKGADLSAFPTLFIVVDEFSELLANKPEFMELFVMIGRLGRSLGVHLLLASQRLDEGRIHSLEGHLSYRVALRTFSAIESRSIIGSAMAYELPSSPGNGYLKFDTTNLVRFKAGYVSGPAPSAPVSTTTGAALSTEVVPFSSAYRMPSAPTMLDVPEPGIEAIADDDDESLLSVLVNRMQDQGPPARQVWLPPLAEPPGLDQLLPGVSPDPVRGLAALDWKGSGALRVPVGVIDRPFEQLRELLIADLSGASGHVAIVGAPQSGKSTLLRTLITSYALTHTPEEVQFYCLDFGGGALAGLADLPHVGGVSARLDKDKVRRTVAEVAGVLERRERAFAEHGVESMAAYRRLRREGQIADPHGDVFLVIDGWLTLRNDFDELDALVGDLAARGLGYGVHVVVSAARWSEIRPSLRDSLGTRFELRLGDPLESEIGSKLAASVPPMPGRGLLKGGAHFLTALPRLDGSSVVEDLAVATKALVQDISDLWPGPVAPSVRMLPSLLAVEELPAPDGFKVAIGLDERRLEPVFHDFAQIPHLMVFGDAETGKTNLLRLVARAIQAQYPPGEARFLLCDFRRDLYSSVPEEYRVGYAVTTEALAEVVQRAAVSMRKRLPGPDITPDRLRTRDWWVGPELFVLVDDYDLVTGGLGGPMEPLLQLLAQGADIGLHVVLARSTSSAMRATMEPLIRRLWELGTPGLVLSYPKEEGKFLGEAPPRQLPPGRAQLVTRRDVRIVHTGFVSPDSAAKEGEYL